MLNEVRKITKKIATNQDRLCLPGNLSLILEIGWDLGTKKTKMEEACEINTKIGTKLEYQEKSC